MASSEAAGVVRETSAPGPNDPVELIFMVCPDVGLSYASSSRAILATFLVLGVRRGGSPSR